MRMPLMRPRSAQAAQVRALQDQVRRLQGARAPGVLTRITTQGISRRAITRPESDDTGSDGEARWA